MKNERIEVLRNLERYGVKWSDGEKLARIAVTLRNWYELECGTERGNATVSVEREDNGEGKPFYRVQYMGENNVWVDNKTPIRDREASARRKLAEIMAGYKRRLVAFVQTDCRGAALYIIRKADIKGESVNSVYTRGVAVY